MPGRASAASPTPRSTAHLTPASTRRPIRRADEELETPYLENNVSTSPTWARDAVALALPDKILCRDDCAGLCPTCGGDLNREPHEHAEAEGDPRWAALGELKDRL